jgi:hypothetical protein
VPPIILTQPSHQAVVAGGAAVFNVEASGWPAPLCQWRKNDTDVAAANAVTLSLSNLTLTHAGAYSALLSNVAGVVTSTVANLAILLPPTNLSLINTGALWRYHDKAQDLGANWRAFAYNDSTWSNKMAELGFGDAANGRPETTLIASNGQWTTYFRHTFTVTNPGMFAGVTGRVLRDDGVVVYLNGTEVFRDNMPEGDISYPTPASGACSDDGTTFLPFSAPVKLLLPGANVIAVEVHQNALSSSDLSFDLDLAGQRVTEAPKILAQPAGQRRFAGDTATFNVQAASLLPLTYQWLRNNTPLSITNPVLMVPALTANEAGNYHAVVGNAVGVITSAPAALVVVAEPYLQAWLQSGNGEFRLQFLSGGGTYSVMTTTNLTNWFVLTNATGSGEIIFTDPAATNLGSRFYRLRLDF